MTTPDEHSTPVELGAALDELIGEISEVKQAGWLTGGHPLHAAFADLMSFLSTSVQAIVLHEEEAGVSPLEVLTPTGRAKEKIAAHAPEDLVATVTRNLAMLAGSVARHSSALAVSDQPSAELLAGIAEGLERQQLSLRAVLRDEGTS